MEHFTNLGEPDIDQDQGNDEADQEALFSEEDVEDGFEAARFSYLFNFFGVPFCLIPLLRRQNGFSLHHAKQAFLLWGLFFSSLLLGWGFLWLSLQALWVFLLGGSASLALNVLGYQRVLEESCAPLPVVGFLADKWFRDLNVDMEDDD